MDPRRNAAWVDGARGRATAAIGLRHRRLLLGVGIGSSVIAGCRGRPDELNSEGIIDLDSIYAIDRDPSPGQRQAGGLDRPASDVVAAVPSGLAAAPDEVVYGHRGRERGRWRREDDHLDV
jgi:hypothetical protein